jgi:hypothetical protein
VQFILLSLKQQLPREPLVLAMLEGFMHIDSTTCIPGALLTAPLSLIFEGLDRPGDFPSLGKAHCTITSDQRLRGIKHLTVALVLSRVVLPTENYGRTHECRPSSNGYPEQDAI